MNESEKSEEQSLKEILKQVQSEIPERIKYVLENNTVDVNIRCYLQNYRDDVFFNVVFDVTRDMPKSESLIVKAFKDPAINHNKMCFEGVFSFPIQMLADEAKHIDLIRKMTRFVNSSLEKNEAEFKNFGI